MNSFDSTYYCINCGTQLNMGIVDRFKGGRCETCNANYKMIFEAVGKVAEVTIQYFEKQEGYLPRRCRA